MRNIFVDSLSGTVGGVLGVLVGSPLDVLKTRLQNGVALSSSVPLPAAAGSSPPLPAAASSGPPLSVVAALRAVVAGEGARSLFKGALPAALGQAPNNFVVFGTWAYGKRWLAAHNVFGLTDRRAREDADVFLAGSAAGLAQALFTAPFEHVKIQQQLHVGATPLSVGACARRLVEARGVARGLCRGTGATLWRDAPTYGFYFITFERIKAALESGRGRGGGARGGEAEVEVLPVMVAGAAAGVISWFFALPADVVKSVIQGAPIDAPPERTRVPAVVARLYAQGGLPVFFRGLAPCLLRAAPVNAVTFLGYEWVRKLLAGWRDDGEGAGADRGEAAAEGVGGVVG